MRGRIQKIIALLLVPCLTLASGPSPELRAVCSIGTHSQQFESQAISFRLTQFFRKNNLNETPSQTVARFGMTRRRWLQRVGGAILAAPIVMTAQPAGMNLGLRKRSPLKFPVATPAQIPPAVETLLQQMRQRTNQFQASSLSRAPDGSPVTLGNFQSRMDAYFGGMAGDALPLLYEHLQRHEGYSDDQVQTLRQRIMQPATPAESVDNFDLLFSELLPSLFARHGFYLSVSWVSDGGISIPDVVLVPVSAPAEMIKVGLFALSSQAVAMRRYRVGPRELTSLHDFNPRFSNWIGYESRYGSDQIFYQDSGFRTQMRDLVAVYRRAIDPTILKNASDPFVKSLYAMAKQGVEILVPNAAQLSDAALTEFVVTYVFEEATRHEAVHIFDGFHDTYDPAAPPPHIATLHEIRAEIVSGIGLRNLALKVAKTMAISAGRSPVSAALADQSEVMVYIRQRLALALLKDRPMQDRLNLKLPEVMAESPSFADLPPQVQDAAWTAFPQVDQAGWNGLFEHLWSELKQPLDNPVTRGTDLRPRALVQEAAPGFWTVPKIVTGSLLVVALGGALLWLRGRRGGPGPSKPVPPPPPVSPKPAKGKAGQQTKAPAAPRGSSAKPNFKRGFLLLGTLTLFRSAVFLAVLSLGLYWNHAGITPYVVVRFFPKELWGLSRRKGFVDRPQSFRVPDPRTAS